MGFNFIFFLNSWHFDFFMSMVSQVCREWEAAALRVNKDVRLARIRIGVVLGKEGGALGTFLPLIFSALISRSFCPCLYLSL